MINAVIVDDDEHILNLLQTFVYKTGYFNLVRVYNSPLKALAELGQTKPSVVFIDIDMLEMDGITLAERISEADPAIHIVFVTAHDQYAVKAFDLDALDYILKPFSFKRINKTVTKVVNALSCRGDEENAKIDVKCFGNLSVKINEKPVKWGRAKAEELFGLLFMHHGEGIHKDVLREELWPEHDPQKAMQILQTTVCKLRNIFAPLKDSVELDYLGNKYYLNIIQGSCELFFVESVLDNYESASSESAKLVESAAQLVGKGFLKGNGYLWAMEKDEELRDRMCNILRHYADYFISEKNSSRAITMLKQLVKIVPYDDGANNLLLRLYAQENDSAGLIDHYRWLKQTLKTDYDMAPPVSTKNLYKDLYKRKYGIESSIC